MTAQAVTLCQPAHRCTNCLVDIAPTAHKCRDCLKREDEFTSEIGREIHFLWPDRRPSPFRAELQYHGDGYNE